MEGSIGTSLSDFTPVEIDARCSGFASASGTQTDLIVVPCFLPHQDAGAIVEDTESSVPHTRLEVAQIAVRHRSQTALCWCWQTVDRSVGCRSRQMNALFDA